MTTDQMMTAIEAATVRRSEFSILVKGKKKEKKRKSQAKEDVGGMQQLWERVCSEMSRVCIQCNEEVRR